MKYIQIGFVGLIILAFLLFLVFRGQSGSHSPQQIEKPLFETRADEQGSVTIKVTPEGIFGGQGKFRIVFNTHSVDLNQDLLETAVLMDDQGNTYKPTRWDGSGPGGHHREGTLVFDSINSAASSVELHLRSIGEVPERLFKWNLK